LISRVLKSVVSATEPRLESRRDAAGSRLVPCAAGRAHIERFDVERREPKGIFAQVAVEVVVDERPVKRGIEADQDGTSVATRGLPYPPAEILHGLADRLDPILPA
jgi:hypothetical protein